MPSATSASRSPFRTRSTICVVTSISFGARSRLATTHPGGSRLNNWNVRLGSEGGICRYLVPFERGATRSSRTLQQRVRAAMTSLDYLVGEREQRWGEFEIEGSCGVAIDDELKPSGLLDG